MKRLLLAASVLVLLAGPGLAAPPPADRCAKAGHPYDAQNPFARLLRGEVKTPVIYEDAHVIAFMPTRMTSPGHALVISKVSCARDITELEPAELDRVMAVVQRIAKADIAVLHADGVNVRQNNGAEAGQTVFHAHFHVVPRYKGVPLLSGEGEPSTDADREKYAALLRAALK